MVATIPERGSVWRNGVLATCQVVVTGAVLFFLYRYLLRVLGAERVGIWAVVLAATSASRVSELGLAAGAIKFVAAANARGDIRKSADVVQTALLTIGAVLGIVLVACFPLIRWFVALIIPAAHISEALEILPYALVSVWLAATGGVAHASLDGCQRADLRSLVTMTATVVYLALALVLTSMYGLVGLGMAQVCQALCIMIVSWVLLSRQIPVLPRIPMRWRFSIFREMVQYGVGFQIISVFSILYEPLTKVFLTKFGGLSATAYFEMANRMVAQVRALVVSANQVLVPKIAAVHETSPGQIYQLYRNSYHVALFLVVPLFSLLVAAVPLVGFVWIGNDQPDFIFFGVAVALGYLINTLTVPAYFLNLGIGTLRWNVVSHVVLGMATTIFGYVLGTMFGGRGAVIGSVVALILASVLIVAGTHKDKQVSFRELMPGESHWLLVASCATIILGCLAGTVPLAGVPPMIRHGAVLFAALLVLTPPVWKHPVRVVLWSRVALLCSRSR